MCVCVCVCVCVFHSGVHCSIILKLNLMNVQKADLEQTEINDDYLSYCDVNQTNF